MAGGSVQIVGLRKEFGGVVAVDSIDLEIAAGEFFSLLGPSGCGKTTTLRLVAGFERPTGGRILIDGTDTVHVPPHKRPVSTVFQSYALFPHMSVGENVAFGLKYHDASKDEITRRVGDALELVQLQGLEKRKPTQLSGGQQQRVALARSLVLNPSVLLLDEPLGALDAKLRKSLQVELKALQEEVGITFIYVTHDQEEALTMSDRMAVMNRGQVEQLGPPSQIYEEPETAYIADFLGLSNLMAAEADGSDGNGGCRVSIGGRTLVAGAGRIDANGPVSVCIRPERVVLGGTGNDLFGTVDRVVYMGSMLQVLVDIDGVGELQAIVPNQGTGVGFERGAPITLGFPERALRVLPR
jgi:spermidine/putrescine transport system ATP-binding protein